MLYTCGMDKKLNVPDEIWLGKKDYSFWKDWKVNGWLFFAALFSCATDIMFPGQVREWPVALRGLAAVLPFIALLLWARSLAQWIRGMDELHRRITVAAILFTVSATFFVVMLWHRMTRAGVWDALFSPSGAPATRWDIMTLGHVFLLLTFCYFLGFKVFSRRYQ
jgi:hypothetical protein